MEITEQKPAENVTTIFNSSRRISIIKPVGNASSRTASPFLITKTDLSMSHLSRKSFLNRDSPLLEKLASMSKTGADGEAIMNKTKGKGNYVFVATEKKDVRFLMNTLIYEDLFKWNVCLCFRTRSENQKVNMVLWGQELLIRARNQNWIRK